MLKSFIQKVLSPDDPIYIILMICINKATELEPKNLLKSWPTTFAMVVLSVLNTDSIENFDHKQVDIYLDKLGQGLFLPERSKKEQWMGLFFIFIAKQQQLNQFLMDNTNNSWRKDININMLCTIDNFLSEKNPDAYEVTKLKLASYRAGIISKGNEENYQDSLTIIEAILEKKNYLINLQSGNTITEIQALRNEIEKLYKPVQK